MFAVSKNEKLLKFCLKVTPLSLTIQHFLQIDRQFSVVVNQQVSDFQRSVVQILVRVFDAVPGSGRCVFNALLQVTIGDKRYHNAETVRKWNCSEQSNYLKKICETLHHSRGTADQKQTPKEATTGVMFLVKGLWTSATSTGASTATEAESGMKKVQLKVICFAKSHLYGCLTRRSATELPQQLTGRRQTKQASISAATRPIRCFALLVQMQLDYGR
jgi:hypothetical protein